MAEDSEDRELPPGGTGRSARYAELNALAKSAYSVYRESGRMSAFNELLDQLTGSTHSILYTVFDIRNSEDRKDVYQEIGLRFVNYADGFDEQRPFLPWWYGIVGNVARDFKKKNFERLRLEVANDNERLDALTHDRNQTERVVIVADIQARLNAYDRELLYEYRMEGWTATEIASRRKMSTDTVKYHIRRALRSLATIVSLATSGRTQTLSQGPTVTRMRPESEETT